MPTQRRHAGPDRAKLAAWACQFHRWPRRLAGNLSGEPGLSKTGLALTAAETEAMPHPTERSLFDRLTRRRPRAARAPEPADMGTAFGMEQWLATPGSELAAPGTVPQPAPKPRSRWLPGSGKR